MSCGGMLIHRLCGLSPPVAIRAVEIQCADAVRAGNTLERNRSIHRFGRVVSHMTIVVVYSGGASGHWVCDFRVTKVAPAREPDSARPVRWTLFLIGQRFDLLNHQGT